MPSGRSPCSSMRSRLPRSSIRTSIISARRLADMIEVRMDERGNLLRMELQGDRPEGITAVVNAIAERYVQVAADLKRQRLTELTKILDEQLAAAQKSLQDAEQALQGYRVATIT